MSFFSLASLLITLAAVSSYINYRYIKLPTTVGVMLVALLASLVLVLVGPFAPGLHENAETLVSRIDFNQLVLHSMLALLLFAGAIQLEIGHLNRERVCIALLALLGTLASTFMIGGATWLILGWLGFGIPLLHALLFGALISPTDPIAVLGIMQSVGASKQLEVQLAGESLFNDGLAVVVFLMLLGLSAMGTSSGAEEPGLIGVVMLVLLFKQVGGALLVGLAAGYVAFQMLKRVDNYQVEVLITLALAMGVYALADALDLSAPIAVVVAGLFAGNQGRIMAMSQKTREQVDTFWELINEILNVVLFLLIGLELLVLPIEKRWLLAGVIAIPIVLAARWVSVSAIIWPLSRFREQSKGAISVLTWGGLRGAVSVAMALSLPNDTSRNLILTLTYFVVVFSILVQGLSIGCVIRRTSNSTPRLPGTQER